jgi:prolyl-tRNA editing enzyme YbaK/EbsC (Cys-tRNA(Pro) deacylase)
MTIFEQLSQFLTAQAVVFRIVHHEATLTSEASAKARGEDLSDGGKAIVMKVDAEFKLFVLSAALKIDSQKIRNHFNAKKTRFASAEELQQLTGLAPGSIPPFGKPILNLAVYVDASIVRNEIIAFNAGSLTDSIIMSTKDYLKITQPVILDFSQS